MTDNRVSIQKPVIGICIAAVLWTIMFSPWTAPHINFWVMMTCSGAALTLFTCWARPRWWKDVRLDLSNIVLGVILAAALWGVFWLGEYLSTLMFDFARPQVDLIYGIKEGQSPWVLSLLLLLLIGPAEEIFWRGYVQERMGKKWGLTRGYLIATACYTLVHLPSCNFMLVMASLVCGAAWGFLYRYFPDRFTGIVISHALWDAAVFVWFPIM